MKIVGRRSWSHPHAWIIERLESWGRWNQLPDYAYGRCPLLFDEVRNAPRAFIPIFSVECEETERAVNQQPTILRDLARMMYFREYDQVTIAKELKVSERHVRNLHESLLYGVKSCLEKKKAMPLPTMSLLS
jgi:hypothetical protein